MKAWALGSKGPKAAGAEKIFAETESGAKTDRAQLAKLMAILAPGDAVLVTRLDRLARSTLGQRRAVAPRRTPHTAEARCRLHAGDYGSRRDLLHA